MLSVTIPDKQNTEFSIRKNLKHNVTHTELKGQSVSSCRNKTRVDDDAMGETHVVGSLMFRRITFMV